MTRLTITPHKPPVNSQLEQPPEPTRLLLLLLLLLDGERLARRLLVLVPDGLGNHLVLGLLGGALVVLLALLEEVLLHPVDACQWY